MKRFSKFAATMCFLIVSLFFLASPSQAYYSLSPVQSYAQPSYTQPYYSSSSSQPYYPSPSINITINFYGFPGSYPCSGQPASQYDGFSLGSGAYNYGYPGYNYSPNSQYYSPPRYAASPVQVGGFALGGSSQYYPGYSYPPPSQFSGTGYYPASASSQPIFYPYSQSMSGNDDPFASGSFLPLNPSELLQAQLKDADKSISLVNNGDKVAIRVGQTLSVALPTGGGYKWYLDTDKLDSNIVVKESDEFFPEQEYTSGRSLAVTGPHEQWIFKAAAPGTTTIRLEIKESESSDALDVFEVEVTVADPSSPYGLHGDPFSSSYALSPNPYEQMRSQFKEADVSLSYSDKRSDVTIHSGETLSIVLPSNPDAGCEWYLHTGALDNDIVVKESNELFPGYQYSSDTSFGGIGAHEQWIFKAVAPGTAVIRLANRETESSEPLDMYEVEVTVED